MVSNQAVDLRPFTTPPTPSDYINAVAGSVNITTRISVGDDIWSHIVEYGSMLKDAVSRGEGFRLINAMKTNPADAAGLYSVSTVVSNIGHYHHVTDGVYRVSSIESHVIGVGDHNPLCGTHFIEINNDLRVIMSYSPVYYSDDDAHYVLDRMDKCLYALRDGVVGYGEM